MIEAHPVKPEYAIYLFDYPLQNRKGDSPWKRHATMTDERSALDQAAFLYRSRQYKKIEVKKKFYDTNVGCTVNKTLKVFEGQTSFQLLKRFLYRMFGPAQ